MSWAPFSDLKAEDTISGLEFGPRNQLACIDWSGKLVLGNPDIPSLKWELKVSRPLFGLAWESETPRLWFGGAETYLSCLELQSETVVDDTQLDGPVLAVSSFGRDHPVVAASTATCVQLRDSRTSRLQEVVDMEFPEAQQGAHCTDFCNGQLVAAIGDHYRVWDIRDLKRPLVSQKLDENYFTAAKWLDKGTLALCDDNASVSVFALGRSHTDAIFELGNTATSSMAPVYALSQDPMEPRTFVMGGTGVQEWDYISQQPTVHHLMPLPCMSIAYSRDGNYVAVGLSNNEWQDTPAKYGESSRSKVLYSMLSRS